MRVAQEPAGAGPSPGTARTSTPRSLGLLAAAISGACALAIGVIASTAGSGYPAEISRGVVLAALLGVPAIVGALGAISGRRVLLATAGMLCLFQSVLAFSGVTLILLMPALLFLRAGVMDLTEPPAARKPASPLRLIALIALAVPVALLAVSRLGIFGLLPIVAFGGLAAGLGRRTLRPSLKDALIGVVVIGLVIGATFAAFALTQTVCWDDYGGGKVVVRILPEMPTEQTIVAPYGGGCSSGVMTIAGTALAGILLSVAVGISAVSTRVSPR